MHLELTFTHFTMHNPPGICLNLYFDQAKFQHVDNNFGKFQTVWLSNISKITIWCNNSNFLKRF